MLLHHTFLIGIVIAFILTGWYLVSMWPQWVGIAFLKVGSVSALELAALGHSLSWYDPGEEAARWPTPFHSTPTPLSKN